MLYNSKGRDAALKEFSSKADTGFANLKPHLRMVAAMQEGSASKVRDAITAIKNLMISVIPEGIAVPQACLYTAPMTPQESEEISMVTITVSNSTGNPQEYCFKTSVFGENADNKAYQFLKQVYATLVENEMAKANIETINAIFQEAAKEAQLSYSIRFVPPLGMAGKKISYIADDSIVFVADSMRLFELDSVIIFMDEATPLVSEQRIKDTFEKLCVALSKAQTPAELVSMHGGDLIALICDISKRVKPMTLLSKVYAKNILSMRGGKDGVGYYHKDGVFAAVARRSGILEVILNPISSSTLEPVDFDVMSAIEEAAQ